MKIITLLLFFILGPMGFAQVDPVDVSPISPALPSPDISPVEEIPGDSNQNNPVQCLQWHLVTENNFRSQNDAHSLAQQILFEGLKFGFYIEQIISNGERNSNTEYFFRYDRDLVINSPKNKKEYINSVENLKWHLNSLLGQNFECSFFASGPRPRISVSN